jgi:hypothetical protein
VHELIEKYLRMKYSSEEDVELEKTVAYPFLLENSVENTEIRIVTGRFDVLYGRKHIHDNKVVNVWAKIFDPKMKEWHEQQNMYAYLLHLKGTDVETININAWYKDWKEGDALRDRTYPQTQHEEYRLKLWPWQETEQFLLERLFLHAGCEQKDDKDLPACTPEERWERFPSGETHQYAVMKHDKAKRATRVFKTMTEATIYVREHPKGLSDKSFIEVRHAQRKRCEKYCKIKEYCNHYVEYAKKKKTNTLNEKVMLSEVK